jgi:FeS assembly SUF system protein
MESSKPQRIPLETTGTAAGSVPPAPESDPPLPAGPVAELTLQQLQNIEQQVIAALQTCYDPEIPVNIHELGLIYGIDVQPTGFVEIRMTLTSPACPAAGSLPPEVRAKVRAVPGVADAKVDVVWEPPWHQGLMSDAARLQLGLDY